MISGTEYYRRKARMSLRELSERSGVSDPVLQKLCSARPPLKTSTDIYMRTAAELGVKAMNLLERHDECELDVGDQAAYPSRTDCMTNCVAVYRREMGLTYAQLAQLLNSPEPGMRAAGLHRRTCRQEACPGTGCLRAYDAGAIPATVYPG